MKVWLTFIGFCTLMVLFQGGCNYDESTGLTYIHLAHTRMWDTIVQRVDPRVESLDLSDYDLILLGGDLTEESSKEKETLVYLDSIFDLDAPSTLVFRQS